MLNIEQIRKGINILINYYGTKQSFISKSCNINQCSLSQIISNSLPYVLSEEVQKRLSDFILSRINKDEIDEMEE